MVTFYEGHSYTIREKILEKCGWKIVYSFCSEDDYNLARDMIQWLDENEISNEAIGRHVEHEVVDFACRIWISSVEDAMAFKLRWVE